MSTEELTASYILPNYGRAAIAPSRGKGAELWDEDGKRYLDFAQGVAVNTLGHSHPAMVSALKEQAEELIHCSNLYLVRQQALLAQQLTDEVVGAPGKCFFCNSGAEANEALIKLARKFGTLTPAADGSERFEIITFSQSFHGRTTGAMTATGQAKVFEGFGPLMPGFKHVEFNDAEALKAAIGPHTVAILMEAVQGEGGIRVASRELLETAAELSQEHNLLLFFDEVQCGIGRIGDLAGWKTISPDITPHGVSWAKGLGGGFPIGAIWVSDQVFGGSETALSSLLGPGTHGSTYGGSPLASSVASAVLKEIQSAGLVENARSMGDYVKQLFEDSPHALIEEVRGLGLMIGFRLSTGALQENAQFVESGKPASIFAVGKLMDAGLLTVPAGPDVVRWLPPLNVTKEELDEANDILRNTFDALGC